MSVGHVIMYKRTPPAAPFLWALLILGVGMGLRWYLSNGDAYRGDEAAQTHGLLILSLCVVASGLIVIAATAKLWFRHLWHKRQTNR